MGFGLRIKILLKNMETFESPQTIKKRILFIITRGDLLGGAQIHVRDLCKRATLDGYECLVACGQEGMFTEMLKALSIPYYIISALKRNIDPLQDIRAIKQITKLIWQTKPDLISCHTAKAGMVGRFAGFITGVPTIFTAHGWQFAEGISSLQKIVVLAIEYICAQLSKKIIVVSEYDYRLALVYHITSLKKLILIHNGMPDLPYIPHKTIAQPELVMIARFQEQKDHNTLFKALALLKAEPWHCTLIGDGPLFDHYKQEAVQLGLDSRITFTGQITNVQDYLQKSDIYLLISNWEGFPRSILEAMRATLPVIASDVGGCKEAVIHEATGYIIPRGDVAQLKIALQKLLQDSDLRKRMGNAGRIRFETYFEFEQMYKKTKAIWES